MARSGGLDLRSKDESALDADVVDDYGGEVAGYHHEAECEGVGGVDDLWRGGAACAEGVHGAPDTWGREVAEAEDGHVVERRAVPFHY